MKRFLENLFFFGVLFILLKPDVMAQTQYVSMPSKDGCGKDSVLMVSFNGKDFGDSKSSQELEFLAKLFKEADIIQLQEVVAKKGGSNAVARFDEELDRTGANWDYHVGEPTPGVEQERMAALWKPSRVKIYKPKFRLLDDFDDSLVRNPYVSLFSIGAKYFAVYSFHLAPTKKNPQHEAEIIASKSQYFHEKNVFLVGDFNLSYQKLEKYFEKQLGFTHHIEGKTSLKAKVDTKGNYLQSEYDNIYSKGNIKVCKSGIVDFVPRFSDLKSARYVSDHLPVFVVFTFE